MINIGPLALYRHPLRTGGIARELTKARYGPHGRPALYLHFPGGWGGSLWPSRSPWPSAGLAAALHDAFHPDGDAA